MTPETRAVPAADIRNGPFRTPLSPDLMARVTALRAALAGAHDMTQEKWLEGFERDAAPAREIDWWERLAAALQSYTQQCSLEPARRPAAFNLAFALAMGWDGQTVTDALDQLPPGSIETMHRCLCDEWGRPPHRES